MSIRCAHCPGRHEKADEVRACADRQRLNAAHEEHIRSTYERMADEAAAGRARDDRQKAGLDW